MWRRLSLHTLFFVFLAATSQAVTSQAWAQAQPESPLRAPLHARGFGMAGAHRASALGAEIINGNPAGVSAYQRYIVEISGANDFERNFKMGNVAFLDNTVGGLGGGYAYSLIAFGEGDQKRTAHVNTLAFGAPLMPSLILGASGRHVYEKGAVEGNAITMDVGLLGLVGPVRLSLSGHNLINVENPDLTRFYAAGLAFVSDLVSVSAEVRGDWVRDPTKDGLGLAYSVGAELLLIDELPLRAGFERDIVTGARHLGLGVGLYGEGSGLDLGYRHELGGGEGRLFSLTLRLQLG